MNLRRQLLLVSLLTLLLPWAGCEFIRETESALRAGQQQMLASTARAIAETFSQYPEEFPVIRGTDFLVGDQLYGHTLQGAPVVDGYVDDWSVDDSSLQELRGTEGPVRYAIGIHDENVYVFVSVSDRSVVFANMQSPAYSDNVSVVSASPPYLDETIIFAAEAPGQILPYVQAPGGTTPEPSIEAYWQDFAGGYAVEARIPLSLLGTNVGIRVRNTADAGTRGAVSTTFSSRMPGALAKMLPELVTLADNHTQEGTRLIITDSGGWRVAAADKLTIPADSHATGRRNWLRFAYSALVEPGAEAAFADPDPQGRERQAYVETALRGQESAGWFRSGEGGRAIVAVAAPVLDGNETIGAVVLQQGTDAILSLRNEGLSRLMNVTLIATVLVAAGLLGYATWLSRRIRSLSQAAEDALENDDLRRKLPSAGSGDEIGDLSRSFANVLHQLGDYNDYLRTLASKLSHELRTPLAIVTSSLENLEHEPLNEASADYTARARDGAERLRHILSAMSEASRVEELMTHAEPEDFDLTAVLNATTNAYRDAYRERRFDFVSALDDAPMRGSPELLIQMLDKLIDNAVDFSQENDVIRIRLERDGDDYRLGVSNPGPPLPERMRTQLFDSMISVRKGGDDKHLGLGLYVAKLIAEGHGGTIAATNDTDGVTFTVSLRKNGG